MNRDMASLEGRIVLLEEEYSSSRQLSSKLDSRLKNFNENSTQKEQTLRDQYAAIRVDVDRFREELRAIAGKLEEIEYSLNMKSGLEGKTEKKLVGFEKLITANKARLVKMEEYLGFEVVKNSIKNKKKTKLGGNKPDQELYNESKNKFDQGDYEGAINGFQTYLDKFPKSKNADNAQFWIGEIFYKEKWYEKAILEYQKVIIKYPKGNKVPAAYLKQGLSFHNLGEKANARLVLNELVRKFPKSSEAGIAKKKIREYK